MESVSTTKAITEIAHHRWTGPSTLVEVKQYVVGYCFSEDGAYIALVQKNRPDLQAGKLNGIGGKREGSDTSVLRAMLREFFEETGVNTFALEWEHFATVRGTELNGSPWELFYFKAFSDQIINSVKTTTDEQIGIYAVDTLDKLRLVTHNHWLIPAALHSDSFLEVTEVR